MQSIPVGTTGSFSLVVMPDHLASRFKDVTLPQVLATPVMIMVMENAALNAIKPFLDAGETALGMRVDPGAWMWSMKHSTQFAPWTAQRTESER
jgi:fluoroacetyl-CoA thioesterase